MTWNIDAQLYTVPPNPMGLSMTITTKFAHVRKTAATKYSVVHVDSGETNNIHSIVTRI